jgi:thiol-disulfide isomerase/thioredoxin
VDKKNSAGFSRGISTSWAKLRDGSRSATQVNAAKEMKRMPVPERRRVRLAIVAAIAGVMSFVVVVRSSAVAQDTQSIVGYSPLYGLSGATGWINSKRLTAKELKGKVVLIDFWDYSCINCIHAAPYIRAWAEKYKDSGLVVIGVHTPEFDFEKLMPNVQKAVQKFNITYPVALDNDYEIWKTFHNQYWPAEYFIDAKGKVRHEHFGEGNYDQSEQWIQELLKEANAKPVSPAR